ncbi:hypothetical protein SteCoe_6137 [Stentor coeruleus]|uniref:HEAT repeat domain-containing protein n=1 Tax=Stentor coeruleus TaxID=5963 RepID=A0A1R2CQR4_9CILI|nr:hypothetical protein SteCoe_6137 [Stentor coeruleus]
MKILKQSIQKSDSKMDASPTKGNIDNITAKKFSNYHSESHPFIIKAEQLKKSLENVKSTEFYGIENLSPKSKAVKCLEHLKSFSKDVKFTALHHLYNIAIDKVTDSVIEIILEELLRFLDKWEELDDEFLEYMLEIIGTIGLHPINIEKIPLMILMIIHDETSSHINLHQAAFSCIFHLGFSGVESLIKLANKEFPYFQAWVLEKLVVTNLIQKTIIVPALAQDALNGSGQIRNMAALAIGRLGTEVSKAINDLLILLKDEFWKVRSAACISIASAGPSVANIAIPVLLKILKEGSINRATVAETIVRLGVQGEKIMIDILNKEPLSNIIFRTSIIKALGKANVNNNNIDYVIETLYKLSIDRT